MTAPDLPTGDPGWADRAVDALRHFHPDRLQAVVPLSLWTHADRLTPVQRAEVVDRVAPRPARS
jgi:hypothetical protein